MIFIVFLEEWWATCLSFTWVKFCWLFGSDRVWFCYRRYKLDNFHQNLIMLGRVFSSMTNSVSWSSSFLVLFMAFYPYQNITERTYCKSAMSIMNFLANALSTLRPTKTTRDWNWLTISLSTQGLFLRDRSRLGHSLLPLFNIYLFCLYYHHSIHSFNRAN